MSEDPTALSKFSNFTSSSRPAAATTCRPSRRQSSFWTRGSVTVEAAFGMAATLLVLGFVIAALTAVAAQIAAIDASATAARHAARGESIESVRHHVRSSLPQASVEITKQGTTHSGDGEVVATVTIKHPLRTARASSTAFDETQVGGQP